MFLVVRPGALVASLLLVVLVTTSKALVTSSDALVPNSFLFLVAVIGCFLSQRRAPQSVLPGATARHRTWHVQCHAQAEEARTKKGVGCDKFL